METLAFASIALGILLFGLVSQRMQHTVMTPPMAFTVAGMFLSPFALGVLHIDIEGEIVRTLAELTLVLVLFTDASRIDLLALRREHNIPVRLLSLGLPLTMVAGAALASLIFPALNFWEAALVGAILAPTDAALGQAVVSSPQVPVRIRQALNVESGLNDGISVPVIMLLIALASTMGTVQPVWFWVQFAAQQVIFGPLVGIGVGYIGGQLVQRAIERDWMNESFRQLSAIALALLAFAAAEIVGGNGFIAAFCAGLTFGNTSRAICGNVYEFAEAEGQLLTLLVFLIFGAAMVIPALTMFDGAIALYALLSLTLIRMVPTVLALLGLGLRGSTLLFLGWFGPRGVASVLFGLLILEQAGLAGREAIFTIVVTTVLFSIFLHGLSAVPGAARYAAHIGRTRAADEMPEHMPVCELPVRLPMQRPPPQAASDGP